jgi:hypothetical protein
MLPLLHIHTQVCLIRLARSPRRPKTRRRNWSKRKVHNRMFARSHHAERHFRARATLHGICEYTPASDLSFVGITAAARLLSKCAPGPLDLFAMSDDIFCSALPFRSTCACIQVKNHIHANIQIVGKLSETQAVLLDIGERTQENVLTNARNPTAKRHSQDGQH